ncbi:CAAX protease [uncultured Brachybacterium sp.]|uniref:CAAX protease n=1 Tax=uncultured Brachybacterium sp. TaxID=189680 RepID=UPI002635AA51|nr:CAAX protease [uncultured Brachybacterium sp.]
MNHLGTERPRPYHRLATLRPEWSAWARPLLAVAAAFIAYVVLVSVVLVLMILVLALAPGVNVAIGVTSGDPTSPLDAVLALLMGAMWLPAGIVGVRVGGWRPLSTAWSVAARFRRDLLSPLGVWVAAGALATVAIAAVAGHLASSGESAGAAASGVPPLQLLLVVVIVLVLAPLQALGLELALRGVILQAVGTWLRSPVLPVVVVAGVSLIGRQLTPAVVIPALALALAAAVLAWKSGGLELPILLTLTTTVGSLIVSALAAGTGAGAGASALSAAVAAPGTSAAALADHRAVAGHDELASAGAFTGLENAALAGGAASAVAVLLLAVLIVVMISRREGLRLLEPVGRAADAPAPGPVLV